MSGTTALGIAFGVSVLLLAVEGFAYVRDRHPDVLPEALQPEPARVRAVVPSAVELDRLAWAELALRHRAAWAELGVPDYEFVFPAPPPMEV